MEKEYNLSRFVSGWSWGNMSLNENSIKLTSNEKDWFSIKGNYITNLTSQNKNDLGMEFLPENDDEE